MHRSILSLSVAALLGTHAPCLLADELYGRVGLAWESTRDARFADRDCAASSPPALFGCGAGRDGRSLGARGDFGSARAVDVALGMRWSPWLRGELLLSGRRGLGFSGQANFLGVDGPQPVRADLRSDAVFAVGYVDLVSAGRLRPYLGLGAGIARNRLGGVRYRFPGIAPEASTTTRGGRRSDFAWLVTVGVELPLAPRWSLDLAWRHADLGRVQSEAGAATIVRPSGTRSLDVAATRARLRSQGLSLSLRHAF